MAQADRIETWMWSQSEQQMVMLQQSKAFAEHKAQTTSEATHNALLKAVKDTELKLEAFQLEVTQQIELADAQKAEKQQQSLHSKRQLGCQQRGGMSSK